MSSSDENEWLVNVGTGIINSMERVINFLDAPSDEDEADSSHPKIRRVLFRDRFSAHELLMAHCFNENPVYDAELFRQRFRMRQPLFLQLVNDLANESEYFRQRPNARGDLGFTPLQKCSVAVRQLAYGSIPDSWDEYFQMSERVARESLDEFCRCIVKLYTPKYLRKPTFTDVQKIYAHHAEVHGFPGMLGSLDCLHWEWSSCPNAWQGQYTRGDKGHPTVILEAVATQDLWIWHAFFGAPGSNNDIWHAFWNRVTARFNLGMNRGEGYRTRDQVYSKWKAMNKMVSHFNGIYINLWNQLKSGENETTTFGKAEYTFREEGNGSFRFVHVWRIVKDNEKWKNFGVLDNFNRGSRSHKTSGSNSYEVFSDGRIGFDLNDNDDELPDIEPTPLPMGRDKAKRKGKATTSNTTTSKGSEEMESIRQEFADTRTSLDRHLTYSRERDQERTRIAELNMFLQDVSHLSGLNYEAAMQLKDEIKRKYNL